MIRFPHARALRLVAAACALAALAAAPAPAAPAELFISEYVEGSSSSKALEVFNGTGGPVTLTGSYAIQLFANGSPTATATIPLTGEIADGDVFVLARSAAAPEILAAADQTTTNFLWNGNDAVALVKAGVVVDVIGQIGFDPGVEWGSGDASTADNTLRRKASVLAGDADGSGPFDPATEWDGFPLDTFDGLGNHALVLPNAAPVGADDATVVAEDGGPTAVDVLANDTDADGDPLAVSGVTQGGNGSVLLAGGVVTYEPAPDFNGLDSFTYELGDGRGGAGTATVSVAVTPVNDPPEATDDTGSVEEDGSVLLDVLANDADADGDALVIAGVTQGAHGTVTLAPDAKSLVYAPDPEYHGADSFGYETSDGAGGADGAAVAIAVTPVNDPPEAADDAAVTPAGSAVTIAVLTNDTDADGDALRVVSASQGATGSVTVNPDGTVTYTPAPGSDGPDSFTYTADDGAGGTDTAVVAVTVEPLFTYDFEGFDAPVDNPPVLNVVKAGSAVPLKFGLGGDWGPDVLAGGYPRSQQVPCDSAAPVDGLEETASAGASGLHYDAAARRYVYVWKTEKAWAGTCRQLVLGLADGSFHRATFEFR